jgi:hypothetical protein
MSRASRLSFIALFPLIACSGTTEPEGGGNEQSDGGGGAEVGPGGSGGSTQGSGGSTQGSGGSVQGAGGAGDGPPTECTPACGASFDCVGGVCVCDAALTSCGAGCVNLQADSQNCGACGTVCSAGLVCSAGVCADACAEGLTVCGASCVDLLTDGTNCGACDVVCDAGTTCELGACQAETVDPDPPEDCTDATDACPFDGGVTHLCKERFALGINYAWRDFAADFGGLAAWALGGVTQNSAAYAADLADMSENGAQTVRWWMFPDFRGDGVTFDGNDNPTGLSAGAALDIQTALDLAEAADVYLVLTIFSFDNFRPTRSEADVLVRGMSPMVRDTARRAALINNVVRKAAEAVAESDNAHRLLGWDVINEPEWAVSPAGGAPSGGEFTPNNELDAITLAEMKALINESAAVLKEVTPSAQVSVGWAAAKWVWAFSDVTSVDFHQPHIYAWVNDYWPYTMSPSELGYAGKPTVMGEFYLANMPFETGPTYADIVTSWYENGYAGAWSWQYNENAENLGLTKTFADAEGCSVRF